MLERLTRAIEDAEHKPGQWARAMTAMGRITTNKPSEAALEALLSGAPEEHWAGFSCKRDSWLAVAAVNALPSLMAVATAAQDLVAAAQATNPNLPAEALRRLQETLGVLNAKRPTMPQSPASQSEPPHG